jgi:putative endonuclease
MNKENNKTLQGRLAEERALVYLQQQGLVCVTRNYACRFGEIDLVMQEGPVLVFVEVRWRTNPHFGGAAASVSLAKQQRIWRTAEHYLMRYRSQPACRFDVVAIDGEILSWLRAAISR